MKKLKICGVIIPSDYQRIYDYLEWEATSPKKVTDFLKEAGQEEVILEISSPGGSAYAGLEIYSILKAYSGRVVIQVMGLAASAASVIMCAGAEVQISPVAQIMIHRAHTYADGDANALEKTAADLDKLDQALCNAYILKTGMEKAALMSMMDKTTWINAEDAVQMHFADKVMFESENGLPMVAAAPGTFLLNRSQVEKISKIIDENTRQEATDIKLLEQKLSYLVKRGA